MWSQRRCTNSRTVAGATSLFARRALPLWSGLSCSILPVAPFKAWYAAPMFRYERPQAGRFRQHHQLGVEILGTDDPMADVEVISLLDGLYVDLGLSSLRLRVNSLGDANCAPGYRTQLLAYLEAHAAEFCDEHRYKWSQNPLRILDCKRPECRKVSAGAPRLADALCDDCRRHFDEVLDGLSRLGISYERDDFLVRGLDYYTRTTFEYGRDTLEGVGGGGRYDGLVAALGGPGVSGVGFGAGIERILLACDAGRCAQKRRPPPQWAARRLRRGHDRVRRSPRALPRASRGGTRRGQGLRQPLDEGTAEGRRPLGSDGSLHRRRRGSGRRARHRSGCFAARTLTCKTRCARESLVARLLEITRSR